jgi:hypothetical protein
LARSVAPVKSSAIQPRSMASRYRCDRMGGVDFTATFGEREGMCPLASYNRLAPVKSSAMQPRSALMTLAWAKWPWNRRLNQF